VRLLICCTRNPLGIRLEGLTRALMVVAERKDFSILTNSSREINESIALTPFYTPFSEGGLNYLRQIKIILNKSDYQAPNSRSRRASEGVNERILITDN